VFLTRPEFTATAIGEYGNVTVMKVTGNYDDPVTTIVVKDRVTGHNPASVLYGQNFYYKQLQVRKLEAGGNGGEP